MQVESLPFYNSLSPSTQKKYLPFFVTIKRPRTQIIYLSEEKNNRVYFLLQGFVRQSFYCQNNREITISILKGGEPLGLISCLTNVPFVTDTKLITTGMIASISCNTFREILSIDIGASNYITQILAHRVKYLYKYIQCREGSSLIRIANAILTLSKSYDSNSTLKITHHEIASLTNLARETVTRSLDKLRELGLIESGFKEVEIIDLKKLKDFLSQNS